jgi:hypothetical protein
MTNKREQFEEGMDTNKYICPKPYRGRLCASITDCGTVMCECHGRGPIGNKTGHCGNPWEQTGNNDGEKDNDRPRINIQIN